MYTQLQLNNQSSFELQKINLFRRLFWLTVISFACYLIVSTILSLVGTSVPKNSAPSITVVKAATYFPVHEDAPNPNQVLEGVNRIRSEKGLTPLVGDARLSKLAELRAQDMKERNYYAHVNPEGLDFYGILAAEDFEPDYACENLSLEPDNNTSLSIQSWLASSRGHRECLLNPEIDIAGYAAIKMYDAFINGETKPYYVVVAVHSTNK